MRTAQLLLAATLGAVLALGAAGCGPGPDKALHDAPAEVVLRRGNAREPDTLDPQRAEDENSREIIRDLFEGLVGESPDGEWVPGAAAGWEVSPDGLAWTFRLRDDSRWSNGDPLTAADFVAGLRRAVDPATASSNAGLLGPIEGAAAVVAGERPPETLGVEALDDHTLRFRLRSPTPWLPGLLTHPVAFPVHGPSLARHGQGFARPGRLVSNGAYQLAEWEIHARVKLTRNPHFREPPQIDTVYYYPVDEPEAELSRYRAGDLDFTAQIPQQRYAWAVQALPAEVHVAPSLSTQFWLFNTRRPPLDDVRVREALTLAVDRERLTGSVTGLGEHPAYGLVPPGTANYEAQSFPWRGESMVARLERAQALLAEAGYGEGRPLKVEVRYNTDENLRRIAVAVASMWREGLDVEASLVNEEFRVLLARRKDPAQWQILRLAWTGDYNDAANFLEILSVKGAVNDTGFDDPQYERLLAEAAVELDPERRRVLLEAAERRMLEHYPVLPLYHTVSKHLVKPWVQGFRPNVLNHTYSRHLRVDVEQRGF
jgi:oligopeptide transport system substrate-binding protein